MSYTTTDYGTWCNRVDQYSVCVEDSVVTAFGSADLDEFDIEGIVTEYRDAINDALPARVSLVGNDFIGPYYETDCDWDGELDIKAIVDEIDFWAIVERHEIAQ